MTYVTTFEYKIVLRESNFIASVSQRIFKVINQAKTKPDMNL